MPKSCTTVTGKWKLSIKHMIEKIMSENLFNLHLGWWFTNNALIPASHHNSLGLFLFSLAFKTETALDGFHAIVSSPYHTIPHRRSLILLRFAATEAAAETGGTFSWLLITHNFRNTFNRLHYILSWLWGTILSATGAAIHLWTTIHSRP